MLKCIGFCSLLLLVANNKAVTSFAVGKSSTSLRVSPLLDSSPSASSSDISSGTMHLVNGISDVADKFDTFLLDMWGVMHDGSRPYDGVLEVVQKLRQEGKKLIILSNSSKRTDNSVKMLRKLGFDPEDFENIITSGEVAYQMLSGKLDLWDVLSNLQGDESKTVFVFGSGDDDQPYCESCGWKLAPMNEAKLIVARGTFTVNGKS
mmetsp:Transcript_1394/g.3041  ORF Transcript_1394/g.3041 Transcript_1394/m.3041 type:complete len:206 (-) Transcript_1394:273-890(-)